MNKYSNKLALTLSVIAIVVSGVSLTISSLMLMREKEGDKSTLNTFARIDIEQYKLSFCHDRQIVPCDNKELRQWNDTHRDDTFNLEAYHNSRKSN